MLFERTRNAFLHFLFRLIRQESFCFETQRILRRNGCSTSRVAHNVRVHVRNSTRSRVEEIFCHWRVETESVACRLFTVPQDLLLIDCTEGQFYRHRNISTRSNDEEILSQVLAGYEEDFTKKKYLSDSLESDTSI